MTTRMFSKLEQRVEWLLQHPNFLVGELDLHKIVLGMQRDGLLSKKTYWPDCRTGIEAAADMAKVRWFKKHN